MTTPHDRLLSLHLDDEAYLVIAFLTEHREKTTHRLNLDCYIGNHEGRFDTKDGVNFSFSARNIALKGGFLHAQLKTSGGIWWDDYLAIEVTFPAASGLPRVQFSRRDEDSRLDGCYNLRLISKFLLACQCPQKDGSYADVYFDLNRCLGHERGEIDRFGRDFARSAASVELRDKKLIVDWDPKDSGVPKRSSIHLGSVLRYDYGAIRPLRKDIPIEDLEYEIIPDLGTRQWLPGAINIRLVNFIRTRRWYLLAFCPTRDGGYRECLTRLSEIIGPNDDSMFCTLFSGPLIPEAARETKLENGWLIASFRKGEGLDWAPKHIDLGEVLTVDPMAGAMTLKRTGACLGCGELFYAGTLYTPYDGRQVPLNLSAIQWAQSSCVLCSLIIRTFATLELSHDWKDTHSLGEVMMKTAPWKNDKRSNYLKRRVCLIIRADPKKKLFRLSSKSATSFFIYCDLLLDVGGVDNQNDDDKGMARIPRCFSTLPRNENDICWLEPERRWQTVDRWIKECSITHTHNREGQTAPFLLSRYLSIAPQGMSAKVVTSSVGERGTYACLSHCWGGKNSCILNRTTEKRFLERIPSRELPRVFAEAINVCQRLGISRLWIDSLCIRQDDEEDWKRESCKMGQYYSNCMLCIAATASPNSATSFEVEGSVKGVSPE